MMNEKETAAFWRKVNRIPDGCWLWTASKTPAPWTYGQLWAGGKLQLAHRLSWELHLGEIPKGFVVCHHCDNPECIRPEHLFLGWRHLNLLALEKGEEVVG